MIIKYISLFAVALAFGYFTKEYVNSAKQKAREYMAVRDFIAFAKRRLGGFLEPVPELCRAFSSEISEELKCPFTAALADADIASACDSLEYFDMEDKRRLASLFSSLGTGFREEETEALGTAFCYFDERCTAVGEDTEKKKRLAPSLFSLAFLALLIFFL